MKKLIITLMMLAALTATAQTGHLTFKGVPIDGSLTSFVGKLKQKGFSQITTSEGVTILKGDFAAYKGCTIAAVSDESGNVYRVGVIFPDQDTWVRLHNNYATLKELLTQKYGNPENVVEEFQSSFRNREIDDNTKMHYVKFDQCRYISSFSTEQGNIELRIDHNESLDCYVVLIYEDASNSNKVRSSAIDDL